MFTSTFRTFSWSRRLHTFYILKLHFANIFVYIKHFCKLLWVLNNAMCCGWTLILSSFLGFCSLWNFSEHFRWNFGKFLDFFFLFIRFSRTLWQYCVWATCAHPSLSLYFWFKFIFTMLFWFYPYICTVLYVPPPPTFVCSNWMCYSLFLEFGGEMLIGLTSG